jgi:hypothetical protein
LGCVVKCVIENLSWIADCGFGVGVTSLVSENIAMGSEEAGLRLSNAIADRRLCYGSKGRPLGCHVRGIEWSIGLFVLGLIQRSAFLGQDSAVNLKIIAEGIANEIDRIGMTRFKVHGIYVSASGAIHNSAYPCPQASHRAHSTRL